MDTCAKMEDIEYVTVGADPRGGIEHNSDLCEALDDLKKKIKKYSCIGYKIEGGVSVTKHTYYYVLIQTMVRKRQDVVDEDSS